MTMTNEAKIAERQNQVRLWLLAEMEHLSTAMTLTSNNFGAYAIHRWYRFAQLAMVRNGAILLPDSQWAAIRDEMDNWPMLKWLSILDNDATINEAKEVYSAMTNGRITITAHTAEGASRPFQLNRLSWAPRGMRAANQLRIWKWLGPIGGELPVRPTE